ncbi:MAG: UDP-N-acetylmuramoyl-L-alanine--D-glutamate ligase [Planctomycetes bacterium]|nr:UDP-N-acetylmuramoyl-L-alanine--D-glutamate ligase [Planctomycetota bacterium]
MSRDLRGVRATVMGLGLFGGGVATARFLTKRGADVLVTDLRDAATLRESVEALADLTIRYRLGEHRDEDFKNADLVVANPAVSPESHFLTIARGHGVPITSELELFLHACPSRDVIAITGTNGKTTTTSLAGEILKLTKPRVFVGGNIGKSLLDCLDELRPDDTIVLEVSSFQLEALHPPRGWPSVAVITNITPDHLDRHGRMEAYVAAKRRILEFQDSECDAILNLNDPISSKVINDSGARRLTFSRNDSKARYTVSDSGGAKYLVERDRGVETRLCPVEYLQIPGEFNIDNALAAAAVGRARGATPEAIEKAISQFRGVAHRLQFVGTIHNIRFYDNSVSTVPESTISALEAVAPPIRWIAGGKSKGLDLRALAESSRDRAVGIYVYGEAAGELASELRRAGATARVFTNLSQAFEAAASEARPGEAVVYSPAFPSFDQYRNYKERGAEFLNLADRFRCRTSKGLPPRAETAE